MECLSRGVIWTELTVLFAGGTVLARDKATPEREARFNPFGSESSSPVVADGHEGANKPLFHPSKHLSQDEIFFHKPQQRGQEIFGFFEEGRDALRRRGRLRGEQSEDSF